MFSFWQLVLITALGTAIGSLVLPILRNAPKYVPRIKAQIPAITSFILSVLSGVLVALLAAAVTVQFQVPALEQRVAILDFQVTNILRLFGSNPATAQVCARVVNTSGFEAANARIAFQHFGGEKWLGVLTSWYTCDGNQTLRSISFKPGDQFIMMLTSESHEAVGPFLANDGKLYFAVQIQWENPNRKGGCLVRYVQISEISSGAGPASRVRYLAVHSEPPKDTPPPDILPCPTT